jgi:very-short-patch-repair endonuclease
MGDFIKASDVSLDLPKEDSPIEHWLYQALEKWGVNVQRQKEIGPYRADIYIEQDGKKIVVECDGEGFHDDKKRDNKRDKYMVDRGYLVFRFTGSEIYNKPDECALRVIEELGSVYQTKRYQDHLEELMMLEEIKSNS